MSTGTREFNFDGLVGPTHNFAGLSPGNVASTGSEGSVSNPRAAALEGLSKMAVLRDLGVGQAVLPPQPRPSLAVLRALGFRGSDEAVLAGAATAEPLLLRKVSSASAMWAANAATVAPASDTSDGRTHLVPANLTTMFHRAIEATTTRDILRAIFADPARFEVHEPLPGGDTWSDEGAANHTRLETERGHAHLFAWGRAAWDAGTRSPQWFPARQTREASAAVARLLALPSEACVLAQQHPDGIDGGAFHTDVLAVGHRGVFLQHELAFLDNAELTSRLHGRLGDELVIVTAKADELPLADAVAAYPFNSQIVTTASGALAIIAPKESQANERARAFLEGVREVGAVSQIVYLDVRESMKNGGGPACLRLRVPLQPDDVAGLAARVLFTSDLEAELRALVTRRYRDRLLPADLADPALHRESLVALQELTDVLHLGAVYDFQR